MLKKPPGQVFPEEFYEMILTPSKFWLKQGENKMLNRLAWLLIICLIGFNTYYMIEIDSQRSKIISKLQSYDDDVRQALGYEMNSRISELSSNSVNNLVSNYENANDKFIKDIEDLLTKNDKALTQKLSLISDKVDYFDTKINHIEENLTKNIIEGDMQLVDLQQSLKKELLDLNSEIKSIDSLLVKLKDSWLTGRILR